MADTVILFIKLKENEKEIAILPINQDHLRVLDQKIKGLGQELSRKIIPYSSNIVYMDIGKLLETMARDGKSLCWGEYEYPYYMCDASELEVIKHVMDCYE